MTTLENLPDTARVWVYQSNRFFTEEEESEILLSGNKFIENWNSHGTMLNASFSIFHNLFIVIGIDQNDAMASGCSIDKSIAFINEVEKSFKTELLNRLVVSFAKDSEIVICHFNNLKDNLEKNFENNLEDVFVFNNTVTTKQEFETNWKVPLKNSWMMRVLH